MNRRCRVVAIPLITLAAGYYLTVLSGCANGPVDQSEELFAKTVADITGVESLNEGLELVPCDSRLYTEDGIGFFVFNHTGHDLVFADNVFGVRGFVFNEEESRWEEIDLGFTIFDLEPRRLRNGSAEVEETSAHLFPDRMDTKGYSKVRLLVVGYAEDTFVLRAYGAYADVEIVEGPDPNVIHVTPTIIFTE